MSGTAVETATEIRPFHVDVPDEDLADSAGASPATRWPEKETVADETQGVQLATIQALVRYWGDGLRLREGRGEAERASRSS